MESMDRSSPANRSTACSAFAVRRDSFGEGPPDPLGREDPVGVNGEIARHRAGMGCRASLRAAARRVCPPERRRATSPASTDGVLVVVEVAEQVLRAGPLGDHDIDRRLADPERTPGDLDLGILARETWEHGEGGAHRQSDGAGPRPTGTRRNRLTIEPIIMEGEAGGIAATEDVPESNRPRHDASQGRSPWRTPRS